MVFFHGKTVFIWKSKCYDILDLKLLLDKKYVYGCGCFCGRVSKNCKSLKATVKFIDSTNVRQTGPMKVKVGQSATHLSNILISPVDIGSFLIHRKIDYKMLNTFKDPYVYNQRRSFCGTRIVFTFCHDNSEFFY